MLTIRKAVIADIDAVAGIYDSIHTEEEAGRAVIGWAREIYPTRETAVHSLNEGDLYVAVSDGIIVAAARINQKQEPAYRAVPWVFPALDREVLVLHTLVVDPAVSNRGIGKAFIAYYEATAQAMGCRALRMDTNARNTRARRLYASLGYRESAVIPTTFNGISGVDLVCLEKQVEER